MDESTLERWFALEASGASRGLVAQPRPFPELLAEAEPTAKARDGAVHRYDVATLRRIADSLSPLDRRLLRLPLTFQVDKEYPGDASLEGELARRLLLGLGEITQERELRDGRLWLSHVQARMIASRHPGAFQFLML